MLTRLIAVGLVVGLTSGVHRADDVAAETKKLQGVWQAVEVEVKGKKLGKDSEEAKLMRFVIKDDELILPSPVEGGKERRKTFKLDPSKAPMRIDITSHDGQEKGQTAACIYKLEKDRLTLCMPYFTNDPGKRPTEFKATADNGMMLIILDRAKAD
jgi:RNA polymerase sigma-70 factor (ECF subfamily)